MCKNCKTSELGKVRQEELEAAIQACRELNINPQTAGFISRHAYHGILPRSERGGTIRFTQDEQHALDRYNAARKAMKDLHNDYIWESGRQYAAEMKARGIKPVSVSISCKRESIHENE